MFWTQWSVSENNVRFLWWNSILTLKKIKKKGSSIFSWFLLFQLSVHIRNNSGQTSRPDPALHKWCEILFEIAFAFKIKLHKILPKSKFGKMNKRNFASCNFYFCFRLKYQIWIFVLNNTIFDFKIFKFLWLIVSIFFAFKTTNRPKGQQKK